MKKIIHSLLLCSFVSAPVLGAIKDTDIDVVAAKKDGRVMYEIPRLKSYSNDDQRELLQTLVALNEMCEAREEFAVHVMKQKMSGGTENAILGQIDNEVNSRKVKSHYSVEMQRVVRDGFRSNFSPAKYGLDVFNDCMLYPG